MKTVSVVPSEPTIEMLKSAHQATGAVLSDENLRRIWDAMVTTAPIGQSEPPTVEGEVEALVTERGTTHGVFTENTVTIQGLKALLRATPNWEKMPPHMREALEMNAHKMGRILHGDFNFLDHWIDQMGYLQRVVEGLK